MVTLESTTRLFTITPCPQNHPRPSRAAVSWVSTEPLASGQAYLFWFLILAILHRKIYVTDNNLKRLGRREVKR